MATRTNKSGFETWTIFDEDKSCHMSFVPEKGGAAYSLIMQPQGTPRELLYVHGNFWEKTYDDLLGGWPFLFPICARIARNGDYGAYLYDGKIYHLPIHGFAPYLPWQVIDSEQNNSLLLRLNDTEKTREVYPFQFEINLRYTLNHNELICEQVYSNRSTKPMPYYAGFHPYFLTPPAGAGKDQVKINFQALRRFQYNEQLTDLVGEKKLFPLPAAVTHPEVNEQLHWLGVNKKVQLIFPEGFVMNTQALGNSDADMFAYLQLYTMPDKPFFCVEPWMGFPNALNTVQGVRWLAPGAQERGVIRVWVEY